MHGCGNDFVVIDNRNQQLELHKDEIKLICDRHYGIGCDQLVVINSNNKKNVSVYALFWNSDGSVSATCGNATRCIANILFMETQTEILNIETPNGVIAVSYTHLRAHETSLHLVCRLLLEKKKKK